MGHSAYSPSGYDRWSVCTASVVAVEKDRRDGLIVGSDESSIYAREGTIAHELHAMCAEFDFDPRSLIGKTIFVTDLQEHHTIDAEMGEEIDRAIEFFRSLLTPGCTVWVEVKVSLDKFMAGQSGTADIVILSADGKHLIVLDLKYGKGKWVVAYRNGQLQLYALGVIDSLTHEQRRLLETVTIVISQPRLNHFDQWETTRGELERFRVEAHMKYEEARGDKPPVYVPGNHCWFCPRQARCKPLRDALLEQALDDPDAPAHDAFKSPDSMSDDELAKLFPMLQFLGAWSNNVKKFMETQALKGRQFKGLKLVEGKRGLRTWIDEVKADQYMTQKGLKPDQRTNTSIVSPAQAEKLIGRKQLDPTFKKLYRQADGKPALTVDDDPRKPIDDNLKDAFDAFD